MATVTAPGALFNDRDHHAADGSGSESGQQPRERDAQRGRVRQSQGDQVAHAIVAPRRGAADVQRDCGQPGPESGDGRRGHGGVVGRARVRVGGAVAGRVRRATGLWTVGSIANAGSAGLTITARVTQAGTVTNTASVTASDQPDPDPADNTATVTLTTETIADLAMTKSLTGARCPDWRTTYTIVVTNTGPSPVTAASVTDVFPVALVAGVDLHRRHRIELRRRLGHGQSRDHRHARGRRSCHVHRDRPDRGQRHRLAQQHGDRRGAGRGHRPRSGQQHGDHFGAADARRRSPDHQGGPGSTRWPGRIRLHDHRDECGTIGCYQRHARPTHASRPDVCRERRGLHDGLPVRPRHAAPGATRTITATFAIPSGYTTPNPIANTATVSSPTPDAASGQQQRDHQHAGRPRR